MDHETTDPICPHHDSVRHYLPGYMTAHRGPVMWLVPPDGDVCCGVDGLYVADRRVLSQWKVTVDDKPLQVESALLFWTDGMQIVAHVPPVDDRGPDPQVTVTRLLPVRPWGAADGIKATNRSGRTFTATLRLSASSDFATTGNARAGVPGRPRAWRIEQDWAIACDEDEDGVAVAVQLPSGAEAVQPRPGLLQMCWELTIPPGGVWRTMILIRAKSAFAETKTGWPAFRRDGDVGNG